MVLLVVFYGLTTSLDLFIAIAVVMFLMCFLWGEKRILVALTTALITPLLIFLLFDLVLMIRFPRGILLNWYYG
jgi:putative tricarboxylic transport membrane protein